ncbi:MULTISPECIES: Na/Pi symporter [Bacillus]|uniref:Na/Pi symporter n=1 Tax=Bacillus TaxID=1386 RepID=UPI0029DE8F5E|nr:Na/Pi symporter [Bacillus alkalisoli]
MVALFSIITLFAVYLAIFLFGMTVMRTGLSHLSEDKLKTYILKFTNHPLKGLVAGALITAVLQSSSAVMVITIGLVAAGYLSFYQSIGIMLGSNIGTTITAELITFRIEEFVVPLLIIGAFVMLMNKKILFSIGATMFGLGCLFVAMNGFETLALPLSIIPAVENLLIWTNEQYVMGVLLGTILTAIIQSSTATTGISMSFLNNDVLTIQTGIAIMLGANIGTCVTAFLASMGGLREARLAAYAHIWLNVGGVLLFIPLIPYLSSLVSGLTSSPDLQLAHSSVIFNVLCSIVVLPFVKQFASFILKVHKT